MGSEQERHRFSDGPLPSVMQEVDLPVINNTACERMYRDAGYVEHIPSIFICAGYAAGGKDSCEVTRKNVLNLRILRENVSLKNWPNGTYGT
jgi:hypothetical protein